jgi:hypothetical protein
MEVLPVLRNSVSLVAVHLSNNLGISEDTKPILVKELDIEIFQDDSVNYDF